MSTQLVAADALPALIAHTWRMVGVEPVAGLGFAEAGGDSLRLLNLVFRLETALDRAVPMDRLDGGMDVAAMAQALDGKPDQAPKAAPLMFLLPGIGGDEPRLAALRGRFRSAIRMEVLAYPDWTWLLQAPRPGFAAIVDHLLEQIERVMAAEHPGAAVQLAGYSYGCRLSHAVADALMQRGYALAGPVLLLDGAALPRGQSIVFGADDAAYSLRERAARWLVRALVPAGDAGALRRMALRLVAAVPRRWVAGPFGFYLRKYLGGALLGPAAAEYQPRHLDADAVLFRSEAHAAQDNCQGHCQGHCQGRCLGRCLGWEPYWRRVRAVDVPGDHTTMIDRIGPEQWEALRRFS